MFLVREVHAETRFGSRHLWNERFGDIRIGMTTNEVSVKLGLPDEIRYRCDATVQVCEDLDEVWCYGVDQTNRFPVRGSIGLVKGRVVYLPGQIRKGVSVPDMDEMCLRRLLNLIDRLPGVSWMEYHPQQYIEIVNELCVLKKEQAVYVLGEYLRLSCDHQPGRDGVRLILRMLFDLPESLDFYDIGLGTDSLQPTNRCHLRRFPVVIQGDVPFLLGGPWNLIGAPEPIEVQLVYYRDHGVFRESKFRPSDQALELWEGIQTNREWMALSPEYKPVYRERMANQILWLLDPVYPLKIDRKGAKWRAQSGLGCLATNYFDHERWTAVTNEIWKCRYHWDIRKARYQLDNH
jgi:hypothetical protein